MMDEEVLDSFIGRGTFFSSPASLEFSFSQSPLIVKRNSFLLNMTPFPSFSITFFLCILQVPLFLI